MLSTDLDRDACYRALKARDPRFDGRFYTAVLTTRIYCRPICPARTPKLENCLFLPSAAAAHRLGFRPCLRCRPEVAPGLAGWRGTASTVSRALTLIVEGALDGDGNVEALAARLGIGSRHLRRLFEQHLGASPIMVAQAQRILFAKKLLGETALPMAEVALAAGFGSVRRFNDTMRRTYGRPPTALRRASTATSGESAASGITLKLPFEPPYDWPAMIGFLAARAIPGVETVANGCYRRTIALDGARGIVEIQPAPDGRPYLLAAIRSSRVTALPTIVGRLRRLFDLDADMTAINSHLSSDPQLASLVAARPGLRVPGAWDAFELAIRAILGQQISVAAASTFAGRLAAQHGERLAASAGVPGLNVVFPRPEALAQADLTAIGLIRPRAAAISSLAAAMIEEPGLLQASESLDASIAKLKRLPGIGAWTAQYIAMRALREPDAFPAADLGLLRAATTSSGRPTPARLQAMAEAWRPWRAYAAMHLWMKDATTLQQEKAA